MLLKNKYILKDRKNRIHFSKKEKKRLILKYILDHSNKLIMNQRKKISFQLFLFKNCSKTKLQNRCLLTGRKRSVYRDFRLSRIKLKEMSNKGMISGLKKYNW
jgi:ribosomal protein S14